jgi:hypothetical protein
MPWQKLKMAASSIKCPIDRNLSNWNFHKMLTIQGRVKIYFLHQVLWSQPQSQPTTMMTNNFKTISYPLLPSGARGHHSSYFACSVGSAVWFACNGQLNDWSQLVKPDLRAAWGIQDFVSRIQISILLNHFLKMSSKGIHFSLKFIKRKSSWNWNPTWPRTILTLLHKCTCRCTYPSS